VPGNSSNESSSNESISNESSSNGSISNGSSSNGSSSQVSRHTLNRPFQTAAGLVTGCNSNCDSPSRWCAFQVAHKVHACSNQRSADVSKSFFPSLSQSFFPSSFTEYFSFGSSSYPGGHCIEPCRATNGESPLLHAGGLAWTPGSRGATAMQQ